MRCARDAVTMAPMAIKRSHIEQWLSTILPSEALLAWTPAASWTGTYVLGDVSSDLHLVGDDIVAAAPRRLGLDQDRRTLSASTGFYALTTRELLLGSRSSVRNRPKDLVVRVPAGGVTVHWHDAEEAGGTTMRHVIVEFGDGTWRTDRIGLRVAGRASSVLTDVEEFFAALGARAVPLG